MAVAFTLYNGFLIVEYSEFDVKAYRSRAYYADNVASYEAINQFAISRMIDDVSDQGDFTAVEYNVLMQELGRGGRLRHEVAGVGDICPECKEQTLVETELEYPIPGTYTVCPCPGCPYQVLVKERGD